MKKKLSDSNSILWRNHLTRTLLVIIAISIIVWFLPRNNGPQYHYDIGKPWLYGTFIAKFDFPIYKSDETIKAEQDSLLAGFEPYYTYNADIEKQKLNDFRNDFKNGIPGLTKDYIEIIADRLHRLYQAGIIDSPEYSEIGKDSTKMVRVVNGKKATSVAVNCIYSTIAAYEQLFRDEKLGPQRQLLQKCNLNDYLEPNLIYDKERSETEKNDLLSSIPPASGYVMSGQKIIDRGEMVDEFTYRVLNSFEKEMKRRNDAQKEITSTITGQTIFVAILIVLFTFYILLYRKDYFQKPRSIMMLYAIITLFPVLVSIMMNHNIFSVYIIPFAMAPVFVRVFMDSRTAFITHVTMILLCAIAVKYQYEFIILQLVAGLTAIFSLRELSKRAQLFRTALFVTCATCLVYFAMQLMIDNKDAVMDQSMYTYFIINGVILLLAYPLMFIIEKAFGFVSNVTLIELSNTNSEVLRQLSEVAQGTFQHSITVSNLASEIAIKIGAKSQLVRTGALYHDIGKMYNPVFFTENQVGVNPLSKMPYTEAAQIVINHVSEGLKIAEKHNLPSVIKDFISTHHGNGKTKYFYISYKNEHPDEDIDESAFTYPGPNPFTREQAILMMADTVEAAARSLPEYTEESISNLVNRLIDGQVNDGYFRECPITFRDIAMAKTVLINRLKAMYHTRISYPELKKNN